MAAAPPARRPSPEGETMLDHSPPHGDSIPPPSEPPIGPPGQPPTQPPTEPPTAPPGHPPTAPPADPPPAPPAPPPAQPPPPPPPPPRGQRCGAQLSAPVPARQPGQPPAPPRPGPSPADGVLEMGPIIEDEDFSRVPCAWSSGDRCVMRVLKAQNPHNATMG